MMLHFLLLMKDCSDFDFEDYLSGEDGTNRDTTTQQILHFVGDVFLDISLCRG